MEDRRLLDGYRQGMPWALERVYRHYVDSVRRLLELGFAFSSSGESFRFVGYRDEFEREEAIQETFFKVFGQRARDGYSGVQPFGPYLLGIARNLVIDDYRRRRRELALFVPEHGDRRAPEHALLAEVHHGPVSAWSASSSNPEAEAHSNRLGRLMAEFVDELEPPTRELIELYYIEGRSQEATGAALGLDRNGVRKQVRMLRLQLLRFMKSRGQIGSLDPKELLATLAVL